MVIVILEPEATVDGELMMDCEREYAPGVITKLLEQAVPNPVPDAFNA